MKRRILKVWQFILLLVMLVLIPQTMFLPVLHVDRDVAENIAEKLKDEAGENIKDNVFLSIAENILLEQIPEESLSGYELMTKFPIPTCFLYFGSLPVLVLLIVFFCFKRTKFVPIIAVGVYSLFGIIYSSIFLWGVPGQIFSGFQPAQCFPVFVERDTFCGYVYNILSVYFAFRCFSDYNCYMQSGNNG